MEMILECVHIKVYKRVRIQYNKIMKRLLFLPLWHCGQDKCNLPKRVIEHYANKSLKCYTF